MDSNIDATFDCNHFKYSIDICKMKRFHVNRNTRRTRVIGGGNIWSSLGSFFSRLLPKVGTFAKQQLAIQGPKLLETGRNALTNVINEKVVHDSLNKALTSSVNTLAEKGLQTMMNKLNTPGAERRAAPPAPSRTPVSGGGLVGRRRYVIHNVVVSEDQTEKMKHALTKDQSCTLRFSKDDLISTEGALPVQFTRTQKERIDEAISNQKGVEIKFSKSQISANKKIEGGFIATLAATLASALLPTIIDKIVGNGNNQLGAKSAINLDVGGMARLH